VIKRLIFKGMNVARINMSHSDHKEATKLFDRVRKAAKLTNRPVAIMIDLQGPKIRLGSFETDDLYILKVGDSFTITTRDIVGTAVSASTTYLGLPQDCKVGEKILLNDGKVELKIKELTDTDIICTTTVSGPIGSHKGINLPGTAVSIPALTTKDQDDLRWALHHGADLIAMSFVRYASDYNDALKIMHEENIRIPVLAKIEKPQAIDNLKEIIDTFDAFMVARGDLGVEMSEQKVPLSQKEIIDLARAAGKPVIVATHMLESMIEAPVPTRAETSDVANAILDGTDATMTSGETSVGKFPEITVETMATISKYQTTWGLQHLPQIALADRSEITSVALSSVAEAESSKAIAIVVFARSGNTARKIAALRPSTTIIAITDIEHTYNMLSLSWGVIPRLIDSSVFRDSEVSLVSIAEEHTKSLIGKSAKGRIIVLSALSDDIYLINHQLEPFI
jgi:pyruvate kinase